MKMAISRVRQALIAVAVTIAALAVMLFIVESGARFLLAWVRTLSANNSLIRRIVLQLAPNFFDISPRAYAAYLRDLLSGARSIAGLVGGSAALGAVLVSVPFVWEEALRIVSPRNSRPKVSFSPAPSGEARLPARLTPIMIGATSAVVGATILLFPTNMDEYLPYHPNACDQVEQQASRYREACGAYPIRLGPLTYERAFPYVGGTSSLLIAPLAAIDRAPWTHFLLGLVALALTGAGLAASSGLGIRAAPALGLFFPIVFALMRDTGPIRLSMVALAWSPFLWRRSIVSEGRAQRMAAVSALMLLWGLATEDKPFFLFLVPMAILMGVASFSLQGEIDALARRRGHALLMAASPAAIAILVPIVGRVPSGPWLLELIDSNAGVSRSVSIARGFRLLVSWPTASHRVLAWEEIPFGAMFLLTVSSILVAWVVWTLGRGRIGSPGSAENRAAQWLVLAAVVGFASITASGGWAIHHYAFVLLPLVGLFLLRISHNPHRWQNLVSALLLISMIGMTAPAWVEHRPESGQDVRRAMEFAVGAAGPDEVVNCASWGCYYPYAYAGARGVPVVFAVTATDVEQLLDDAHEADSVIFVCMTPEEGPHDALPPDGCMSAFSKPPGAVELLLISGQWRVERVLVMR